MSKNKTGEGIARCFSIVAACGREIEALIEAINSQDWSESFKRAAKASRCEFTLLFDASTVPVYRCDESEWVNTDVAWSIPVRKKGKRKPEMYLSFQVSLHGDGCARGHDPAVLHVSLWAYPPSFDEEVYVGFPMDNEDKTEVVADRLLVWRYDNPDWTDFQWTYSLDLGELRDLDSVNALVLGPSLALLMGCDVQEALPDALFQRGLMKYPDVRVLQQP
ncbi:MAG TPA: hypothetical protein PKZ76_13570 [Xanthomonadaceae bacterium]|nr:hypothetical protein [Xanthomonadaceae bacterium]